MEYRGFRIYDTQVVDSNGKILYGGKQFYGAVAYEQNLLGAETPCLVVCNPPKTTLEYVKNIIDKYRSGVINSQKLL